MRHFWFQSSPANSGHPNFEKLGFTLLLRFYVKSTCSSWSPGDPHHCELVFTEYFSNEESKIEKFREIILFTYIVRATVWK